MSDIILFNKPFQVLSQFTDSEGRTTLKDYLGDFPGFYVAGRLDYDSEGLLLLTNDGNLQHRIAHPSFKLPKTYLVQVEGILTDDAIKQLIRGITLKDGITQPAKAKKIAEPVLWERNPPVRQRKKQPTDWLELTISEGRNRQVRRMTAHVGHPTLRLIRKGIGQFQLNSLQPGEYQVQSVHLPVASRKKGKVSHKRR